MELVEHVFQVLWGWQRPNSQAAIGRSRSARCHHGKLFARRPVQQLPGAHLHQHNHSSSYAYAFANAMANAFAFTMADGTTDTGARTRTADSCGNSGTHASCTGHHHGA